MFGAILWKNHKWPKEYMCEMWNKKKDTTDKPLKDKNKISTVVMINNADIIFKMILGFVARFAVRSTASISRLWRITSFCFNFVLFQKRYTWEELK